MGPAVIAQQLLQLMFVLQHKKQTAQQNRAPVLWRWWCVTLLGITSPVGEAASSLGCQGPAGSPLAVHPGVWKGNRHIGLERDTRQLTSRPGGDGDGGGQV